MSKKDLITEDPIENLAVQLQSEDNKNVIRVYPYIPAEKEAIPLELKLFSTVKVNIGRFFNSVNEQYTGMYVGNTPNGNLLIDFSSNGFGQFEGSSYVENGVVEFFPHEVYFKGKKLSEIQLQDSKPPLLYHRKPTMKMS